MNRADLTLLDGLNLVNLNGTAFNPSTNAQVKTWLLNATPPTWRICSRLSSLRWN